MAAIFELIPHVLRPVFGYEVPDLKLRHGATSSTFIKQAGNGTMSKETQAQYLGHEFHVMRAYLRFASGLLSLIRLPRMPDDPDEYTITQAQNHMVHMVRRFGLPLKLIDQGEPDQNTMTRLYCSFLKAWAIGGILDRDPEPSTSPRQPPRGQSGQGEARHRSTLEGDVATALDSAAAEGDGWPDRLFFGFIALWAREWTHYTCWEVARTQGATRGQEGVRSDSASNALEALLADWGTSDHRAFIVKCRNAVDDLARFLSVEESVDLVDNVDHCVKTCLKLENEFFRAVTAEVS